MEQVYGALAKSPATAAVTSSPADHEPQNLSAAAPSGMHYLPNGPLPPPSSGLAAGATAAPTPSFAPAAAHCTASLEHVAAAFATVACRAAPRSSAPGSSAAAGLAGDAGLLPAGPAGDAGLPIPPAVQPTPHASTFNPSMWSNFAAAAADPSFFSHLSNLLAQPQQHQQPDFSITPLNTGLNASIDHAAAPSSFAGAAINTTAPAAAAPVGSHLEYLESLPGSPSFLHSTLSGSLSNAAAAAAAAFSNASLGTSSCGEACDKTCSHCGKVEQRQWRKRGDGTLLCNRCFMWRRNHGGIALPPLDPAPMPPAITKQHSVGARASSSGGGSSQSRQARHFNPGMDRALQELAGLQDSGQGMRYGSLNKAGSYSAPSSPACRRSHSGTAASSPARRRRGGSPDDPEYRPRGNSKLNRSTSHVSDDYSAAAAASAGARSLLSGHNMITQLSKLRPRSRLARAGGSGAWQDEEGSDMGQPADHRAEGRQLQHQGSSGASRLAAAAATAAAAAESDKEVVSAAEVLAGLLSMGSYEANDLHADQQEAAMLGGHELAAAAAPPPTSIAAHQGGDRHQLMQQAVGQIAEKSMAVGAAELRRSSPGSIGGSWMCNPSTAGALGKGSIAVGSIGKAAVPSFMKAAAPPAAAEFCKGQPLPLPQQQPIESSPSSFLSPVSAAKAEEARAAAAAGAINPHVCRAVLTALAAGASAESIDLASTQRKFEVMEQQLHVPHSPAAAHLLSRMSGR
ncbi:hypothetical protein COO60DRAFT_1636178 [Scenedesmus sp. NREL 46B-D3]|nr:hypothetical protein COO60DRAFT_1636178 [Scenedesmus sp. NREL 46B-D3]